MIVDCSWCEGPIETSNRTHPGYCSPTCRALDHQNRVIARIKRRQRIHENRQRWSAPR